MRQVFQDAETEKKFLQDGFVVLPGFIPAEACEHLTAVFNQLNTGFDKGFHVTNWSKDYNYKQTSHEEVCKLLLPAAQNISVNYKPVLGCYAVKYPGEGSEMGIHQDWSLCDESVAHSFSVWCPLQDVEVSNGAMQFYRGSHNIYSAIRGKDIPFQWKPEQQYIEENLLETLPVKAGDAVLLHHRIVHRSLPNLSGRPRLAAMLAMIPQEQSVKQFFMKDNHITVLNQPDDFYVHYDIGLY